MKANSDNLSEAKKAAAMKREAAMNEARRIKYGVVRMSPVKVQDCGVPADLEPITKQQLAALRLLWKAAVAERKALQAAQAAGCSDLEGQLKAAQRKEDVREQAFHNATRQAASNKFVVECHLQRSGWSS
jgi:hypothetical protein